MRATCVQQRDRNDNNVASRASATKSGGQEAIRHDSRRSLASDPTVDKGLSSDPTVDKGLSSDPTVDKGLSSDPTVDKGLSSDPARLATRRRAQQRAHAQRRCVKSATFGRGNDLVHDALARRVPFVAAELPLLQPDGVHVLVTRVLVLHTILHVVLLKAQLRRKSEREDKQRSAPLRIKKPT
eukprot:1195432-Prorocentrum_minimum.AAC.1